MKVLGLIVEYNPFHNGHLYHLEQSKKLCNADYTVCVMSGNFIQRGEPAIVNKWARAKMALISGVDLVIELPAVYAMSSAEFFGFGAVKILDSLGIVDNICFGSESGNINELEAIADILYKEPATYKEYLKENLSKGMSFPTSREAALTRYFKEIFPTQDNIIHQISSSNNILGIEYLKALKLLESKIAPLTIKRAHNLYNSENLSGNISSATSIRAHINKNKPEINGNLELKDYLTQLKDVMSSECLSILLEEFNSGRGPVASAAYGDILLAILRKLSNTKLNSYAYITEGLENRIKAAAQNSGSFNELVESINTKRYTATRIQRVLFNILSGITSKELNLFNTYGGPQYIRVLGFNKNGRLLLSKINKKASLPVIIKAADFKNSCNPLFRRMLEIEEISTNLYVLGYSNPHFKKSGQEFTQNVIRI